MTVDETRENETHTWIPNITIVTEWHHPNNFTFSRSKYESKGVHAPPNFGLYSMTTGFESPATKTDRRSTFELIHHEVNIKNSIHTLGISSPDRNCRHVSALMF